MEKIIGLLPEKLDTNRYSFIDGGNFDVQKFEKYINGSFHCNRLLTHALQVGREQTTNYGLEFENLCSAIRLIAHTQNSLIQIGRNSAKLEDFSNVLDFLDWDNINRNGKNINDSDYKPMTLIDQRLYEVYEFAIKQGHEILKESEANLLFDNAIRSTKENDQYFALI